MAPRCDIVDSHHHIGIKASGGASFEFSGRDLIDRMDRYAIRSAVAMHFVSALRAHDDFVAANEYVATEVADSGGRLFGAAAITPLAGAAALDEIRRCESLGFRAVKLHPEFTHYALTDGRVDAVAQLAGDLGLPVVIHSDFASRVCSPYEVARLARRHPATTFVLLHLGLQPELCRTAPEVVSDLPNVMVDTSQTPDSPGDVFVHPVRVLGPERVLFGSDGPFMHVAVNLRKLEIAMEELGLSEADAVQLLATNACRVFRLD